VGILLLLEVILRLISFIFPHWQRDVPGMLGMVNMEFLVYIVLFSMLVFLTLTVMLLVQVVKDIKSTLKGRFPVRWNLLFYALVLMTIFMFLVKFLVYLSFIIGQLIVPQWVLLFY